MAGSNSNDASLDDLFSLLSEHPDEQARARVVKAMYDPDHAYSYFIRQPTGDDDFAEAWPPSDISPAIREILETQADGGDGQRNLDDQIAESANSDIQEYLAWEQSKLEGSLVSMLPDDQRAESELAYRSGKAVAWSVLQPFIPRLREIVANEWDWSSRDAANEFSNDTEVAVGLAAFLADYSQELPFAPAALACALVRLGLGRLCQ